MLKKIKEIASDSAIYGSSTIIAQLISLVLVPFFSKELSPEEYGMLGILAMTVTFLEPVVGLGMDSALFRYFAKTDDVVERKKYFTVAILIKGTFIFLVFLLLVPLFELFNDRLFSGLLTQTNYHIFLATFLINNIASMAFVILRVNRQVKRISVINIIVLLTSLSSSIYLVLILKMGVKGALLALLVGATIKAILFLATIISNLTFERIDRGMIRKLFNYGLPQVPHKIMARMLSLFTLFMVNEYLGLAVAGLYVMAKKFAKPVNLIVSTVQTSWAPYKFQIHREEKNPVNVFEKIIPLYWVLLIFIWGTLSMIAPWLFKVLIDVRYNAAIPFIPFIMALSIFEGFRFTVSTGFELSDRQKMSALASFLGLSVFVVLSLFSIDYYSPYSFILSQCLAYIIMGLVLYRESRKVMIINYPFKWILLYLFSVLTVVVTMFQTYNLFSFSIAMFFILVSTSLIIHRLYSLPKILTMLNSKIGRKRVGGLY